MITDNPGTTIELRRRWRLDEAANVDPEAERGLWRSRRG
jgi:hypothetical protein